MVAKKHVYRVGDYVSIRNYRPIKRVGYPLIWTDLIDEVKKDPHVLAAFEVLCGRPAEPVKVVPQLAALLPPFAADAGDALPMYFIRAAAMLRVEQRNFGGSERQLIYEELDGVRGVEGGRFSISGKRVVQTGKRFAESGGTSWTMDGPDDWYEPGGLENRKTHVLLTLGGLGEFDSADVEPA